MTCNSYRQLLSKAAGLSVLACALIFLPTMVQADTINGCDRDCMTRIVGRLLESMTAHDPDTLPLATVYRATENSHPAALGMMTLWRTVTEVHKPDLLAIDTNAGQAYFALTVSESRSPSILWGRIKVENQEITELELYINRSRGDHGFSYSAEQLPENYKRWMSPPADRDKASREELMKLAEAAFKPEYDFDIEIGPDCQFTEMGWSVIDPGLGDPSDPRLGDPSTGAPSGAPPGGGFSSDQPLGCMMPPGRPSDPKARNLVIDEELGIVVVGAVVPGLVYPYPYFGEMLSAFIPSEMSAPRDMQQKWFEMKAKEGKSALLTPTAATGEVLQVLQYYDGKLQGEQINVYLSGPGAKSVWVGY